MSERTNHFRTVNKRILWLTDKIASCQVNDKPFEYFLRERESLIWLTDKVADLSKRLLKFTEPDNKQQSSLDELTKLKIQIDTLERENKRLKKDVLHWRENIGIFKREMPSFQSDKQNGSSSY